MFAFRHTTPTRKVQQPTKTLPTTANKNRGLKIFGQHPNKVVQDDEERCDNSSVDMSLYTTQSKSTIRYLGQRNDYEMQSMAPTEFTTEKIMRNRLGGWASVDDNKVQRDAVPSLLTPDTMDESSIASSGYDLQRKSPPITAKSRFVFDEEPTPVSSSGSSSSVDDVLGAYTEKEEQQSHDRAAKHTGPVDLDESVAETSSMASSSNSWVLSPSGLASPKIYFPVEEPEDVPNSSFEGLLDFATNETSAHRGATIDQSTVMSPSTVIQDEDNEDESPFLWTDNDAEDEDEVYRTPEKEPGPMSQRDSEILNRTYAQTMDSISSSRQTPDVASNWKDSSPGALRLTEGELEKHLEKVQNTQPIPSSTIVGYDSWKQQQELKRRYFAKVQAKLKEKKRHEELKQPLQAYSAEQRYHPRPRPEYLSPDRSRLYRAGGMMDSTRSAMDQSIDSSIPTLDAASPAPRRKPEQIQAETGCGRPRRWGLFSMFRSPNRKSKDGPSTPKKEDKNRRVYDHYPDHGNFSRNDETVVSLSQFMRISCDEPSEVAGFSVAPLETLGRVTLGSDLPGGETLAATRSHCVDSIEYEGAPKHLALHYLEIERQKQRESDAERIMEARMEQERIAKLKEQELRRQRRLNLQHEKPPLQGRVKRSTSIGGSPPKPRGPVRSQSCDQQSRTHSSESRYSRDSDSTNSPGEDSVLEKNVSVSSKHSVASSLQSKSMSFLAPCVICNAAERSHLAMPCMHFSFCGDCVEKINRQSENPVCPVCQTWNVAFTRVYTG